MKGKFITVEGGEGAGKSTCLDEILATLARAGIEPVTTREPGSTEAGERVRAIVLDADLMGLTPEAELLLLYAARAQLLDEVVKPALASGRWVVSDRFSDASFAYQGGGRGIARSHLEALERWIVADRRPDLTILLDVDPAAGLKRATSNRQADRLEKEAVDFYARVRQVYLDIASAQPDRVKVIDAGRPLEEVRGAIRDVLEDFVRGAGA